MMNISRTISALTQAIREYSEQRKHEFEWFKSYYRFATKNDLMEMEKRLIDAIAKSATITPSIETAARVVQAALDKLDAAIPDKETENT